MEPLIIQGGENSPSVILNKQENNFEISGRSLPEEVIGFYSPVMNWLEKYVRDPNDNTLFRLKLDYINSASQRAIQELLTILEKIKIQGKDVEIDWYFMADDDDMKEAGEEYSETIDIPFNFKSYQI
ncbi:MAG: DUF1987 domain-containing protein [Bacteroidales bacterium]|nr:MAG: DUF1987 domain-containing protein [Bacteroidales bacterium]